MGGMLEGALILLLGLLLGRLWPRGPRRPLPGPPSFRCTCSHQKSMHLKGSGICCEIKQVLSSVQGLSEAVDLSVPCTCQVYIGPEPPELIVGSWEPPEIPSRRR